jgi:glycosyltransferase involved in cell wall biosynthesis
MVSDLAFHLASRGWSTGVITSRQRYDDASAKLAPRENVHGVDVRRVWSTRFGRASLPGRAIDYATFYCSAFFAIRRERDAIIVPLTDPPLISVVAALASHRLVNWLQDLFPEVANALGIRAPRFLRRMRDWSLRRARMNVAIGREMAKRIGTAHPARACPEPSRRGHPLPTDAGRGATNTSIEICSPSPRSRGEGARRADEGRRVTVRDNWADAALHPIARDRDAPFTVAYSGNLGRAHEFGTMVDAMHALPEVRFVITGGGAQLERVRAAAPANVVFQPYAPRERLSESLSAADAHLVTLQPSLEGLIVPSKFYGIIAVARPAIFIGARNGEIARSVIESGCGYVIEPRDTEALVDAIRYLASHRVEADEMGKRGRALYESQFAPEIAFAEWERILAEASND